ncbi:MAG: hypothetical protein R2856_02480 [Caldilineaceae bacterium]
MTNSVAGGDRVERLVDGMFAEVFGEERREGDAPTQNKANEDGANGEQRLARLLLLRNSTIVKKARTVEWESPTC